VARETLRTGGKILIDIVENMSPQVSAGNIISKDFTESTQRMIGKL